MSALVTVHSMVNRIKQNQDWQTWILGALLSGLFLLITWGYQSISGEIARNKEIIDELQRTGTYSAREQLINHNLRIEALEKSMERNQAEHEKILNHLQTIENILIKKR